MTWAAWLTIIFVCLIPMAVLGLESLFVWRMR
jgi:hypothetical protein